MTQDPRFAAIDIGSNSFHLIIATVTRDGQYRVLGRYRQKVRLADGFDKQFKVSDTAIQRGRECLTSFSHILKDIPPQRIRCVATATLRKAANSAALLRQFEDALQHPIDVISGEDEARLIYQGATQQLRHSKEHVLVLDIGGASTEIISGQGVEPKHLISLDMGCVTWQNRYFADQSISENVCQQAIDAALAELQPHAEPFIQSSKCRVCGTSGIFRTLYDMRSRDPDQPMTSRWLRDVLQAACRLGHVDALNKLGIRRDRQAVFIGGLCILIALVEGLGITEVEISEGALREGLLVDLLTQSQSS